MLVRNLTGSTLKLGYGKDRVLLPPMKIVSISEVKYSKESLKKLFGRWVQILSEKEEVNEEVADEVKDELFNETKDEVIDEQPDEDLDKLIDEVADELVNDGEIEENTGDNKSDGDKPEDNEKIKNDEAPAKKATTKRGGKKKSGN